MRCGPLSPVESPKDERKHGHKQAYAWSTCIHMWKLHLDASVMVFWGIWFGHVSQALKTLICFLIFFEFAQKQFDLIFDPIDPSFGGFQINGL